MVHTPWRIPCVHSLADYLCTLLSGFLVHTPWWIFLGSALVLNLDAESMTNVHLSHRKCISASVHLFSRISLISYWIVCRPCRKLQYLAHGQLTRMQHGSSSILEFASPKFQTLNTHKCSKISTSK